LDTLCTWDDIKSTLGDPDHESLRQAAEKVSLAKISTPQLPTLYQKAYIGQYVALIKVLKNDASDGLNGVVQQKVEQDLLGNTKVNERDRLRRKLGTSDNSLRIAYRWYMLVKSYPKLVCFDFNLTKENVEQLLRLHKEHPTYFQAWQDRQ
jgi:hypothetical protein